jgi:hypothetical protein
MRPTAERYRPDVPDHLHYQDGTISICRHQAMLLWNVMVRPTARTAVAVASVP